MTKEETVRRVARATGNQEAAVHAVVDAFIDVLQRELQHGNPVYIKGLGKISPVLNAPRTARNQVSGETIRIPARTGLKFTPYKPLIVALRENENNLGK